MVDLEVWKDEILDSIKDLYDETKLIRKYLEGEQDDQEDQDDPEQDDQEDQDDSEQEDQDDPEQEDQDDPEHDFQEVQDFQELIIEKLDDINESVNILNTTVVESSIVISISIIIALAFHYFINQISKW